MIGLTTQDFVTAFQQLIGLYNDIKSRPHVVTRSLSPLKSFASDICLCSLWSTQTQKSLHEAQSSWVREELIGQRLEVGCHMHGYSQRDEGQVNRFLPRMLLSINQLVSKSLYLFTRKKSIFIWDTYVNNSFFCCFRFLYPLGLVEF